MRKHHVYVAAVLAPFLSPAAFPADEPLEISVFATAGSVNRYLGTPEDRQKIVPVLKRFRVSRVFVEGNRSDTYVPVELLKAVREDFASQGIEATGGIGPLPGKTFGVHVTGGLQNWLDYRAEKSQQDIARVFSSNAAVFHEMIVDDFYCFNEGTPESRRDLLVRLIDTMMLKPARAVRPDFRVIIKLPQWYDRFQEFGYDPARMTAVSDRIWVGTETRNPETPGSGYVQPTEGYINFRWLSAVAGPKIGGAWFDTGDCTAQNYIDQAYQSVLAGARELTLFDLGGVMRGHPGYTLLEAALPELFELAERIRGRQAEGIAYYKPSSSDGEENLYLMEYLAMAGLPIVPVAQFPSGRQVIMLGSHAAANPGLPAAIKRELARGATVVLTPALLRRTTPEVAAMAGVTVSPRMLPGVVGGLEVDLSLAPTKAETRLAIAGSAEVMFALTGAGAGAQTVPAESLQPDMNVGSEFVGRGGPLPRVVPPDVKPVPLVTARRSGRGQVLVANLRAFSADDTQVRKFGFRNTDWFFPPHRLGLPEISQPLADALRRELLGPLKTSFEAPSKIAFYMLGDARVLYNFRNQPVQVKVDGKAFQAPANGLVWR